MRSYDERQTASSPVSAAPTPTDAAGLHITAN